MRKGMLNKWGMPRLTAELLLLVATFAAMVAANSGLAPLYSQLHRPPLSLGINDGLMTMFFITVGMEIRREVKEGYLQRWNQVALPLVAAIGGMIVPALIYTAMNAGSPSIHGWAIPTATDIAFALGVLALASNHISASLRMFLLMLAIFDDVLAVIVIAVFYSGTVDVKALVVAGVCVGLLYMYGHSQKRVLSYVLAGAALWLALLSTHIHPALAGVVFGGLLPQPLEKTLTAKFEKLVNYMVLPIFAFANAGVALGGISLAEVFTPLPMGIAAGLFFGKQMGIFLAVWLVIRWRMATLPQGANWGQMYGVCVLAGIGFTMSLFIGALAFGSQELSGDNSMPLTRLGVLAGSLASAIFGAILLRVSSHKGRQSL